MPNEAYAIKDWNETFENFRTRALTTALRWVQLPTKQDALGFRMLMRSPEGVSAYGVFIALVQIAAKVPNRGVLADDKGPMSDNVLAARVGCSLEILTKALEVLTGPEVGWIIVQPSTDHRSTIVPVSTDHPTSIVGPFPSLPSIPASSLPSSEKPTSEKGGEHKPIVKDATGSAGRFLASRTIATGNAPPRFVEFANAYPTGHFRDRDGILELWTARGLEEKAQAVLDGLALWIVCEEWRNGFVTKARKFIETRQWEDTPPPPKPVATPPEKVRYW